MFETGFETCLERVLTVTGPCCKKKGISANVIEVKNAMARNTSIRGCGNGNDKKGKEFSA